MSHLSNVMTRRLKCLDVSLPNEPTRRGDRTGSESGLQFPCTPCPSPTCTSSGAACNSSPQSGTCGCPRARPRLGPCSSRGRNRRPAKIFHPSKATKPPEVRKCIYLSTLGPIPVRPMSSFLASWYFILLNPVRYSSPPLSLI